MRRCRRASLRSPASNVTGTSDVAERIPLAVPQMGVVSEVIVLEWLVASGVAVNAGDPVVLVETDKAETELEAPAAGTLEIVVTAGDTEIPVGTVLAYVVVP